MNKQRMGKMGIIAINLAAAATMVAGAVAVYDRAEKLPTIECHVEHPGRLYMIGDPSICLIDVNHDGVFDAITRRREYVHPTMGRAVFDDTLYVNKSIQQNSEQRQ